MPQQVINAPSFDPDAMRLSAAARASIRSGAWTTHTSGLADDLVQGNLVILPQSLATDFLLYCERNPKPCPLLAVGEYRKGDRLARQGDEEMLQFFVLEGMVKRVVSNPEATR